jgi:hypothetical protein
MPTCSGSRSTGRRGSSRPVGQPGPVNPATVPKAMDVTTPAGVSQATELDDTVNQPVTIQGVVIPAP